MPKCDDCGQEFPEASLVPCDCGAKSCGPCYREKHIKHQFLLHPEQVDLRYSVEDEQIGDRLYLSLGIQARRWI